jgi:exosortase B
MCHGNLESPRRSSIGHRTTQQVMTYRHLQDHPIAPFAVVLAASLAVYASAFAELMDGTWSTDQHSHGPIVFAIAVWLLYRKWPDVQALPSKPVPALGMSLFVPALAMFGLGRILGIQSFEIGSLILVIMACYASFRGVPALKAIWFPLFFMLFMVPLPGVVVDTLTQPMKLAVSAVTESILYAAGYPIARSGVILQLGPYQLLVADACAGLNTLLTLEAMGLLYLNLVRHQSTMRNVVLALLIVPISFAANVIRVIALALITYHLGDEAGQGFLHGFAGFVLFIAALFLIIAADSVLRIGVARHTPRAGMA